MLSSIIIMLRFCEFISKDAPLRLYETFVMPHSDYCSSVWHFCGVCSTQKIDTLNNGIHRFVLQDYNSLYDSLLSKFNSKSLYKRCLQTFLIIIMLYKSLFFTCYPGYLRKMFCLLRVCTLQSTQKLCFVSTIYKKYYLWSSLLFTHGFKTMELSSGFF